MCRFSLVAVHRLLTAPANLLWLIGCRAQAQWLWPMDFSYSLARGIFLDLGSNPLAGGFLPSVPPGKTRIQF